MPVTLQPTSLKYKDSNGVFQNATAIQGESPVVAVADITNGHRITITDAEGAHSFDVMDGNAADAPVQSVNGQTGAVVLTPSDIGAGTYSKPSGGIPASDLAAGVIPTVPVQDVQVNGSSVLSNGVANVPIAGDNTYGAVRTNGEYGVYVNSSGFLQTSSVSSALIKSGVNTTRTIKPVNQHESTFYGLAKAAGDTTQSQSSNPVGTYTNDAKAAIQQMLDVPSTDDIPTVPVQDVQVNGTSVLSSGVANVPVANADVFGVVKTNAGAGIDINPETGKLRTASANGAQIRSGTEAYKPIVPNNQHTAAFYGLAKAAGDTTQSSVVFDGTYTDAAKSAISQMLNGSVAVTGTTPAITALPGIRYVCGEVATLDITLPASGIVDVVFESGSTATVLTVTPPTGVTVKWANGFDPTSLDANTTYEINVCDGLGVAASWT